MLRLTTVGRRSGRTRVAILGFIEDGPNIVVPAMNGWMDPEPAWWLNLQAHPEANVTLPGGEISSTSWREQPMGKSGNGSGAPCVALGTAAYTDANAATRSRETAIVVFEPTLIGFSDRVSRASRMRSRPGSNSSP